MQSLLNDSNPSCLNLSFITQVVIKAEHGHDTFSCCLQNVDRAAIFWNVIARFSDNLRCCKNLFSSTKVQGTCTKCRDQGNIAFDLTGFKKNSFVSQE